MDKETCSTSCCFCIECSPFYWKELNAQTATAVLLSLPVGSYLVRPSQHPAFKYAFSQKEPDNRVTHIRIGRDGTGRYLMDMDETTSNLPVIRFSCVVKMIKCWCKIYRDVAKRWRLTPVSNSDTQQATVYINEEKDAVCFHDDDDAENFLFNFCADLVSPKS